MTFIDLDSILAIGWKLGLIAAIVHHFTCQFPVQLDVLSTVTVWMVSNVAFITACFLGAVLPTTTGMIIGLLVFNTIYVHLVDVGLTVVFNYPRLEAALQCFLPASPYSHRDPLICDRLGPLEIQHRRQFSY